MRSILARDPSSIQVEISNLYHLVIQPTFYSVASRQYYVISMTLQFNFLVWIHTY